MKTLPESLEPYKKTPFFSEESVPAGLLKAHQTKAGSWGKIVVVDGRLRYRILEPAVEEMILSPQHCGVIEPTVLHEVLPLGKVQFYVEFYRDSGA
ncbi:MAG: DUF1971 domain-containing protein [Gammaproteobacteria bacterium]|nr:DUF1971 domain-containing protein [Gammaproteobacteria bacterium]